MPAGGGGSAWTRTILSGAGSPTSVVAGPAHRSADVATALPPAWGPSSKLWLLTPSLNVDKRAPHRILEEVRRPHPHAPPGIKPRGFGSDLMRLFRLRCEESAMETRTTLLWDGISHQLGVEQRCCEGATPGSNGIHISTYVRITLSRDSVRGAVTRCEYKPSKHRFIDSLIPRRLGNGCCRLLIVTRRTRLTDPAEPHVLISNSCFKTRRPRLSELLASLFTSRSSQLSAT